MLVTCVGILVSDIIASGLPRVSNPGEVTFTPSGVRLCVGGHAANVSIDLVQLGLKKGEVSAVGTVGVDSFGEFIIREIKKSGVETHIQKVEKTGTSLNLILVVQGEDRRFHIDIGANSLLDPHRVRDILRKERPLVFYVGATGFLGDFDEQLPATLKNAKEIGCLTFVDPIEPYGHGWEFLNDSLEWVDVLHCNNREAEGITGKSDVAEALRVLNRHGVKLAVITAGKDGLAAKYGHETMAMPAFTVPVVDPTGAGDAFCAGAIRYLTKSMRGRHGSNTIDLTRREFLDLLLEGEACGAACVTDAGTTKAVTIGNVLRILGEQKKAIIDRTCSFHEAC